MADVPTQGGPLGGSIPDCGSKELRWAIPAGILNSLWCDFFPRMVALTWLHQDLGVVEFEKAYSQENSSGFHPLTPGTGVDGLLTSLKWLQSKAEAGSQKAPCEGLPSYVSKRLDSVIEFFEDHEQELGSFPIVVPAQGGYDFLLSSWGIEMFVPTLPEGGEQTRARELLRYFTFRQPGRPSLGIPGYLDKACSMVSVDAPTGPSQIEVEVEATGSTGLLKHLSLPVKHPEVLRLLGGWGLATAYPAAGGGAGQLTSSVTDSGATTTAVHSMDTLAEFDPPVLEGLPPLEPRSITMSMQEYMCALRPFRCWQVEGTVYRGMAAELPRIVATAWMEMRLPHPTLVLEKLSALFPGSPRSYRRRFGDAGDDGLRGLFCERLETMLPTGARMVMKVGAHANKPGLWVDDDVMITNLGFYFPGIEGGPPTMIDMLKAIANGRAGNPVFTDSKRPDRDGE